VSNRLISKVMAMVAEDRKVVAILNILLSGEIGINIKPSGLYACGEEGGGGGGVPRHFFF
jgi:hypothetical protein